MSNNNDVNAVNVYDDVNVSIGIDVDYDVNLNSCVDVNNDAVVTT